MTRTSLLLLSLLGAADAGAPAPDAGPAAPAAPSWRWEHGDGGWIADGGVTDRLTLRVGETARVQFPLPLVLMQCDEPLLGLAATEDTLLLTGLKAGHTLCGCWYSERSWPHRFIDVTVTKEAPVAPEPRTDRAP